MRIDPKLIIEKLIENGYKVRKTARDLNISPGTVVNWHKKAKSEFSRFRLKRNGLKRRSTKPRNTRSTIISAEDQDNITILRKETGYCSIKIKNLLRIKENSRTIHRFIKKKGLVPEQTNYKRPLFQNTKHMHARNVKTLGKLQMDVKYVTPELSGLEHTCYLYAVIDIFSRYKLGIIYPLLDQGSAISALKYCLPILPLEPDFIQTDNGLEFQKTFKNFVQTLGLDHHYIHKSNPNENAVIERSFRTDEDEFFYWDLRKKGKPKDMIDLNIYYQEYLAQYNTVRPHLGIDLMTPLEKIKRVQ